MRLACQLRRFREQRDPKLSLRDVEAATGISRGYLSRYERGRELPRDDKVPVLEETYGMPSRDWYILDGTQPLILPDEEAA